MKKIKEIKIVNQDQSTEVANIGADAINVDYNDTTVKDELDKLNIAEDSLMNIQTNQGNALTSLQSQVSSLASGSPAGAYATVTALISADPDHSKIYVVAADGHWYYYNSGWQDGGIYQASETRENSIEPKHLSEYFNVMDYEETTTLDNTKASGYISETHAINLTTDSLFKTIKIDIENVQNGIIKTADKYNVLVNHSSHQLVTLAESDDTYIRMVGWNSTSSINGITYNGNNSLLTINVDTVKASYPNVKYIYICMDKVYTVDILGNYEKEVPNWFGLAGIKEKIENIQSVKLDLMDHATAVVGHEFNIYKHTILHSQNNDMYDTKLIISNDVEVNNYGEVIRLTPTLANIGQKSCKIQVEDKYTGKIVKEKSFILDIIADNAPANKKVIFIGDSLTENGIYAAEIVYNLSNQNIQSLGTIAKSVHLVNTDQTVNISTEGRASWSANDYVTKSNYANHDNAFWNPTTSKFDFSYYMQENNFSNVDIVCLNLGTNGDNNETISALLEMIESIHQYDPSIIILISLINLPCTQTGYGYRGFKVLATEYAKQVIQSHDLYKETFSNITNVYLTEVYINLDSYNDFNEVQISASARNPKQITVQNNTVHPSSYGYFKMADVYYNNLLYYFQSNE